MANIADAIKNAQDAAANIVEAEVVSQTLPATQGQADVIVNYAKPSMGARTVRGLSAKIDHYLGVNKYGISIGKDKKMHESIDIAINMVEGVGFLKKETIKWGDNPPNYASRYEGPLSSNGEPWVEIVARARRMDPRAKVYESADIVGTLLVAAELSVKGTKAEVGAIVQPAMSMSNWRNWEDFYFQIEDAGLLNTVVNVRLTQEAARNKGGIDYGVFAFERI